MKKGNYNRIEMSYSPYMKQRTIPLLHPNWSEWSFKEKKEYLLIIKKVLKCPSQNDT